MSTRKFNGSDVALAVSALMVMLMAVLLGVLVIAWRP